MMLSTSCYTSDIIIRPADKGSGIVLVDKDEYVSSLIQDMEDSVSHEPTDGDMTRECHKQVKKLVSRMYRWALCKRICKRI
jgi:hypothetical protein